MQVHEVIVAPEVRTDAFGDYRYVCIGAWENLAAKQANLGDKVIIAGQERTAQLFNDFKVRYSPDGRRIITRLNNGVVEWQRVNGSWVAQTTAITVNEDAQAAGRKWARQDFSRDTSAEIQGCIDRYLLRATQKGYRGDMRGTTLNLQCGETADDANETASTTLMSVSASSHGFGQPGISGVHGGVRFPGVSGLSGATINSATLTFRALATDSGAFVGDWHAHDAEAPGVFTTTAANLSSRARTTATCEGDSGDFGNWTSGSDHTFTGDGTNDIADIIQELADSYDPSAIALLWIYTSGTEERVWNPYEVDSALAMKMDVDYTAVAGSGHPAVKRMGGVRFAYNLGYGVW